MMPNMSLSANSSSSATSGDVSAPNSVFFGNTGGGASSGTDVGAMIRQYWPLLAGAALIVVLMRKRG